VLAAQHRVPRRREGRADGGRGLEGGLVHREARTGLRAAARVYAGWGFFAGLLSRAARHQDLGYSSLEDFLVAFWEGFFLPKDPNNLLAMLWTCKNGDISANEILQGRPQGRARRDQGQGPIVMPARPTSISRQRTASSKSRTCQTPGWCPVPSIWGHFAGGPGTNPVDVAFIDTKLKELLAS